MVEMEAGVLGVLLKQVEMEARWLSFYFAIIYSALKFEVCGFY